jgi:hypothetical protein
MKKLAQYLVDHFSGKETDESKKIIAEIVSRLKKAGYKAPFTVKAMVMLPPFLAPVAIQKAKEYYERQYPGYEFKPFNFKVEDVQENGGDGLMAMIGYSDGEMRWSPVKVLVRDENFARAVG